MIKSLILLTTTLLIGHAVAASSSLRGAVSEQEPQEQQQRQLYGMEYGHAALEDLMQVQGDANSDNDHEGTLAQFDPEVETSSIALGPAVPIHKKDVQAALELEQATTHSDAEARIVNGFDTRPYPAFAITLKRISGYNYNGCAATLISNCHMLTAAHCVTGRMQGQPNGVYINAYKPYSGNANLGYHFSTINPSNIKVHPQYDGTEYNRNDVAVMKLDRCVADMDKYPPMEVADETFMNNNKANYDKAAVIGLGKTSFGGNYPTTLQEANVPLIDAATCSTYYPGHIDADDHICAGTPKASHRTDACGGDSGGPLILNDNVIVGIVSSGEGCAGLNRPGIYASTAKHFNFIQSNVCNDPDTKADAVPLCQVGQEFDQDGNAQGDDADVVPTTTTVANAATTTTTTTKLTTTKPTTTTTTTTTAKTCSAKKNKYCSDTGPCCGSGLTCQKNKCKKSKRMRTRGLFEEKDDVADDEDITEQ